MSNPAMQASTASPNNPFGYLTDLSGSLPTARTCLHFRTKDVQTSYSRQTSPAVGSGSRRQTSGLPEGKRSPCTCSPVRGTSI